MLGLGTLMRPSHPRLLASRKSQMPRVRRSCCRAGGNASGIAPPMPEQHCRESSHQHSDGEGHHGHSHFPESPVSRLLDKLGLISLSTELTHSGRWTMASITCFAIALMAGASEPTARLMGGSAAAAAANALQNIALAGTFALSWLPQAVEAACIAGSGRLDTHVLMSLAVVGTLVIGMAQEVGAGRGEAHGMAWHRRWVPVMHGVGGRMA